MVEINNLTSYPVNKKFFKKIAGKILKKEKKKNLELSIVLVNKKKIKELNRKYRGKDSPTDVLAFSGLQLPKMKNILGEVIICPQEVKKNSKRFTPLEIRKIGKGRKERKALTGFKTDFKKEMISCLIHGILHILGYDHEGYLKEAKIMDKKQKYYLSKIFN